MTDSKAAVCVLGGGSFGTTLANLMACEGQQVTLWLRDQAVADHIRDEQENPRYLPGFKLDPRLQVSTDIEATIAAADLVFLAIPSGAFPELVK